MPAASGRSGTILMGNSIASEGAAVHHWPVIWREDGSCLFKGASSGTCVTHVNVRDIMWKFCAILENIVQRLGHVQVRCL